MSTSRQDIEEWFNRGMEQGKKYMLVICDTYDHDDYPAYASSDDDCIMQYKNPGSMQRVMEVYDLSKDKTSQLNEHRCNSLPAKYYLPAEATK